ncbi:MAG: hypothetical protein KAT04_12260 [Methylococcales bacterium]|nr:hypothetical protein [Methylococcales bacterium]
MISKLVNSLLVPLLFSASVAVANSDYPATDFQPKVLYQDSGYKHSSSSGSRSSSSRSSAEVSTADSAYPAANFQPEVLYKDSGYRHTKGTIKPSAPLSRSVSNADVYEESSAQESEDDSMFSLIMGLSVLAVAGFVFFSKNTLNTGAKRGGSAKRASSKVKKVVARSSVSGVDKYLESKEGPIASGVSKYLEEREVSVSGVAKYVAKQKISAKVASVTGVEKYLKDRG